MIALKDKVEALAWLDVLKDKVVDGRVIGFIVAYEQSDETFGIFATSCENSREFAGTLMDMAIRRLHYEWSDATVK